MHILCWVGGRVWGLEQETRVNPRANIYLLAVQTEVSSLALSNLSALILNIVA